MSGKAARRAKHAREAMAKLEAHERTRAHAAAAAAKQHTVPEGMRAVPLDSIADQLDEVDPRIRGTITSTRAAERDVDERPGSPTAFRRLNGEFVPPRYDPFVLPSIDHRENEAMQTEATFVSSQRIQAKKLGVPGGKTEHARLKLPTDIIDAIGLNKLIAMTFEVELNDEGILFRPAGTRPTRLPSWASGAKAATR